MYITKENKQCDIHSNEPEEEYVIPENFHHKVHYEIMPHSNTLKVSIRGPSPCCIVPGVRTMIEDVRSCYYPGITCQMHVICPLCEMEKIANPQTFSMTSSSHDGLCSKSWHKIGSIKDILLGMYTPPIIEDTRRIVGETLEDHFCPKLFVVLPININCLSLMDRFVYSYLKDGYAVHLLCECPDQWHFVDSPGFRIAKPKQFLEKYGKHLRKVLRVIGELGTPLRIAAAVDPAHCRVAAAMASEANSIANQLEGFLENVFDKYPKLKPASDQVLGDLETSSGLQRSELAKFLEIVAKGREFGPLVCTYVDKHVKWLWLCEDHSKRFAIVKN